MWGSDSYFFVTLHGKLISLALIENGRGCYFGSSVRPSACLSFCLCNNSFRRYLKMPLSFAIKLDITTSIGLKKIPIVFEIKMLNIEHKIIDKSTMQLTYPPPPAPPFVLILKFCNDYIDSYIIMTLFI